MGLEQGPPRQMARRSPSPTRVSGALWGTLRAFGPLGALSEHFRALHGLCLRLLMTKMRFMATFRVPWPALHAEMLPFLAGTGWEALGSFGLGKVFKILGF